MTSNLGSQVIQELAGEANYAKMKAAVMQVVTQHFRPEFINRVDEIVVFHPLGREQIRAIVEIQLGRLRQRLTERDIQLRLEDDARDKIGEAGFDTVYGARPLKRAIQAQIENPLAQQILRGDFVAGDRVGRQAQALAAGVREGTAALRRGSGRRAIYCDDMRLRPRVTCRSTNISASAAAMHLEAMQKISDTPLKKCPECGKNALAAADVRAGVPAARAAAGTRRISSPTRRASATWPIARKPTPAKDDKKARGADAGAGRRRQGSRAQGRQRPGPTAKDGKKPADQARRQVGRQARCPAPKAQTARRGGQGPPRPAKKLGRRR